jgi:hypothetical protein
MPSIGFIAPLLPGKTETDRSAMIHAGGGSAATPTRLRASDLVSPEKRSSSSKRRTRMWRSRTWEADDLDAAFKGMATSEDPFDRWFRDHVRDIHGINVEDGFPPPEQVMDYRA